MRSMFHGGVAGKLPGDLLVPSPPHQVCGCPVCAARAEGRVCTVAEFRLWAMGLGERGRPILEGLRDANPFDAVDPPTGRVAVYVTTDVGYARWYAARSQGDLYVVEPVGDLSPSNEDPFPSWTCDSARVVRVVERRVRLTRKDRREMLRRWNKEARCSVLRHNEQSVYGS